MEEILRTLLEKRKAENTFRTLTTPGNLIDFFSNDYLGLANSEELHQNILTRLKNSPAKNGATGSRLLSGNSNLAEVLEEKLADHFNCKATTLFNSGYNANVGVLSSIPQKGDTILYDELAHASLKEGARLSLATRHPFKHNDLDDLEKKIVKAHGHIYIVVESVYSMDGDMVPLKELVALSEKYKASIILDEAHSTGIHGMHGNGLANELNLQNKIDVIIYTFGKAMGNHGACVGGSKTLKSFLINFSRSFIYTTALPPHSLIAIEESFKFLKTHDEIRKTLQEKIKLFKSLIVEHKTNETAIQSIMLNDTSKAKELSHFLIQHGFDVRAIVSPTVPKGKERLRICLHVYNSDDEITRLCQLINNFKASN